MKRKKKEDGDAKEPKPKKYKKKIENPEKQRARYVYDNKGTNGKLWEKNRRDRLNNTFDELALLLPPKDPPGKMSKVEILSAAIQELQDLRKKVEQFNTGIQESSVKNTANKETKDASCNTDMENKENCPVSKVLKTHKKIQVNFLRKRRKIINPDEPTTSKSNLISFGTQTSSNEGLGDDGVLTSTDDVAKTVESSCMALIPYSKPADTVNQTSSLTQTSDPTQTVSNTSSYLSNTMRVTPALISTPIMTPSLFISNYPLIVSQIPPSVYIVNNKTEVNTTVNKVVAVKSKSVSGHVPLPPLKKNVTVKKPPRKKRILKKKSKGKKEVDNEKVENKNQEERVCASEITEMQSKESDTLLKETVSNQTNDTHEKEKINEKSATKDITNDPKMSDEINQKQLNEISLPATPLPISPGKLLERINSNSSLLNLETNRKSFSPASQDTSHINDTSAISNLDIENFSLLTANILSGIDANDTSETSLSTNIGKILEDKEIDCSTKSMNLSSESVSNEKLRSQKLVDICQKSNEVTMPKHRETIQVRKGLLQSDSKASTHHNSNIRPDINSIPSSSSSYDKFTISTSAQSMNYPNFTLSLSQEMRNRSKPVSDANSSKLEVSATYTMTGPTYSSNLNYSGYYCNSNNSHTSLQQLYSNQHTNNIISSNYSKTYDSQRPYYTDQPSTNFTFSLTSAGKSHAKYVSSGTKSQSLSQTQSTNVQESCKKYNNNKSVSYNYSSDNIPVKSMPSHSIARLNSKYDNHKENDTPFYLSQDVACTKSNTVHKSTYNQSVFSNNTSSCARYPQQQQLQTSNKQSNTKQSTKNTLSSSHQSQMPSRYDVDWMSSSEIKPITNDFQLFPSLDSSSVNQNSYYSSSMSNFDINRKTSDLYFAHPPGEENLPWSPSRMSNILDTPHLGGNQCFPSTLPNLHGDLALNTLSSGSHSRPSSIFETPTKASSSSYNHSYSATKETKRVTNPVEPHNSFSVRQLVDVNQSSKSTVPNNDKLGNMKRKSTSQKETESENYEIIPYEKANMYSAESLINSRHSAKNKSWHTESSHVASHELNQNNPLFSMDASNENQYNYSTTRYEPLIFNQNYVTNYVDNSFSNTTQNFHNFSKSQAFSFGDSNYPSIDYNRGLGNKDTVDKHNQNYYSQSSKSINAVNTDLTSSRNNISSTTSATASHSSKKLKSSHHVPTSAHHSLIMNYDFPVPPVTPSLTYFPTHEWKATPTEPYHNACNSSSYVNSSNLYTQNILQNSQTQNLASGLSSNNSVSQNTSNSLTNFNLSTICPEINDKVRQQNW